METLSAPPLIVEQGSKDSPFFSAGRASKLTRPIFILLILVVLVEAVIVARTLTRPKLVSQKIKPLTGASVALITDKTSYREGEDVFVLVRISTGGHNTVGADLSVKFDPQYLSLLESTASANFLSSSIYNDFPNVKLDKKTGQIKISGIASANSTGFNGLGVFGELAFKALKNGNTKLTIDYTPNSTTLSTVVDAVNAKNLLSNTTEATVNIGQGSSPAINLSCGPRVQLSCLDSQGRLGSYWCASVTDPFACKSGCFQDKMNTVPGCKVVSE